MLSADTMLAIEAAYTRVLGKVGVLDWAVAEEAIAHILRFTANIEDLRQGTASDGLVVPALARALRTDLPEQCHKALHSGLTQVPHFPAINRRFCRFGVSKTLILLMWNPGFSM